MRLQGAVVWAFKVWGFLFTVAGSSPPRKLTVHHLLGYLSIPASVQALGLGLLATAKSLADSHLLNAPSGRDNGMVY